MGIGSRASNPDVKAFGDSLREGLERKIIGEKRSRFSRLLLWAIGGTAALLTLAVTAVIALGGLFIGIAIGAIVASVVGAAAGLVAGWAFPETFTAVAHLVGLQAPYQFGAALGFVSAFFGGGVIKRKS